MTKVMKWPSPCRRCRSPASMHKHMRTSMSLNAHRRMACGWKPPVHTHSVRIDFICVRAWVVGEAVPRMCSARLVAQAGFSKWKAIRAQLCTAFGALLGTAVALATGTGQVARTGAHARVDVHRGRPRIRIETCLRERDAAA